MRSLFWLKIISFYLNSFTWSKVSFENVKFFFFFLGSWFKQTVDMFSRFLAVQLICNMIYMASAIFELDLVIYQLFTKQEDSSIYWLKLFIKIFQKVQDIDFDIFLLLIALSTGGLSLFLICFFGKMSMQSYEDINASLNEYNWYELPVDLQKYVLLMIQNMQKPHFYHGFHVVKLDLGTFSKVR